MSENSNGAREMVDGFRYVAEVYANASRMLLSCDPIVADHGFLPYGGWGISESPKRMAAKPKSWMPHYAVRQYYPPERRDQEILTIGAYFWDPESPETVEPLCVASMMAANGTSTDAVYPLGMLGAQSRAPRGRVEWVNAASVTNDSTRRQLETVVRDGRILSIAVSLLDVTSTSNLEERLLKPLLAALQKTSAGAFVMPASGSHDI